MSTAEIKKTKLNLISWIEQLSDANMLTFLDGLRKTKSEGDWWQKLSVSQKHHINEGVEDIENGRVVSSAEFWNALKNG